MAVFRIEKTRDYTVMSNHHLRNTDLSLKAKGLLSLMLSLPDGWDYTTKGLARICKDGVDSICAGIQELEKHGYVIRERVRLPTGQLGAIEYTILEQPRPPEPKPEKPERENPVQVKPVLGKPEQGNPDQLNIDISNTYPSSKDISNPIQSNPPTPTGTRMGSDGMETREIYREMILENIDYEILCQDPKVSREQLDEIRHLQEVAHLYGEQAEEMFRCWDIPKRFLAFGDTEDLAAIKRIELLDYEAEEESGEAEDDWEEKFFRSLCGALGNPKVMVMDLGELLDKTEEQDQPQSDTPTEN